ncbi:hypothetical protein [Nocardia sp. NPDC004860]|uniref:hypothetical protein n=1 Tax=Nocardia sp. NPDC004860 TaxID=3154557 RepID=UPI0033A1F2CA
MGDVKNVVPQPVEGLVAFQMIENLVRFNGGSTTALRFGSQPCTQPSKQRDGQTTTPR